MLVGMVDSPEVAAEIVETMNRVGRLLDEVRPESGRERSRADVPIDVVGGEYRLGYHESASTQRMCHGTGGPA